MENPMHDERRRDVALFRLAVLGDLVHTQLRRGALRRALEKKAREPWVFPDGKARRLGAKTIQSWLYTYRKHGFDGLIPRERKDRGCSRSITPDLQALILDMKREDPGRSTPLILRELQNVGLMRRGDFSASAVNRLLTGHGLSGPKMELEVAARGAPGARGARHRFVAATCGELWQGDACHGPKLFDPAAGRAARVKIFGLLDDKSRLVTYLRASFHERQEDFLRVLFEAVRRRGVPRSLLLDNHGSFTGADARVTCARLGIRLVHARPGDGASKGKIERFWRTLRGHVLDRLVPDAVQTIDELNLRLMAWVNGEYNIRPHSGLGGRTPLDVFEEDAGEIRFVTDSAELEAHFVAHVQRAVKNDSTCTVAGKVFEVPPHLRGHTVTLYYQVLRPDMLWLEDGTARVPLREVDAVANSRRPRVVKIEPREAPRPTGLNAVEGTLKKLLHPDLLAGTARTSQGADGDLQRGAPCAP
jgi:transposase InsO family protein